MFAVKVQSKREGGHRRLAQMIPSDTAVEMTVNEADLAKLKADPGLMVIVIEETKDPEPSKAPAAPSADKGKGDKAKAPAAPSADKA